MPQICNIEDFDPNRELIRQSLDTIANDVRMAMRDDGLGTIPTYIVIPNSGDAIATVMTPLDDVSDDVWAQIMEIAWSVIQDKIGSGRLRTRAMVWTMANEPSGIADETVDPVGQAAGPGESSAVAS
jgi:hypothetical protein